MLPTPFPRPAGALDPSMVLTRSRPAIQACTSDEPAFLQNASGLGEYWVRAKGVLRRKDLRRLCDNDDQAYGYNSRQSSHFSFSDAAYTKHRLPPSGNSSYDEAAPERWAHPHVCCFRETPTHRHDAAPSRKRPIGLGAHRYRV